MQDSKYGVGYMTYLIQKREAARAQREVAPKPPTLQERIEDWYNGLSDDDKRRAWTMKEFRDIFCDSPQVLGAALWALGWSRKRMWRDDRPTSRYWSRE